MQEAHATQSTFATFTPVVEAAAAAAPEKKRKRRSLAEKKASLHKRFASSDSSKTTNTDTLSAPQAPLVVPPKVEVPRAPVKKRDTPKAPRNKKRPRNAPKSASPAQRASAAQQVNMGDSDSEEAATIAEDVLAKKTYDASLAAQMREEARRVDVKQRVGAAPRRAKKRVGAAAAANKVAAASSLAQVPHVNCTASGEETAAMESEVELPPSAPHDAQRLSAVLGNVQRTQRKGLQARAQRHDKGRLEVLSQAAAEHMRQCLGVKPGAARRALFEETALAMQKELGRPLVWSHISDLMARIERREKAAHKDAHKATSKTFITDDALAQLVSPFAQTGIDMRNGDAAAAHLQIARLRARIESDTPQEARVAEAAVDSTLRAVQVKDKSVAEMVSEVASGASKVADLNRTHREGVMNMIDPLQGKDVCAMDDGDDDDERAWSTGSSALQTRVPEVRELREAEVASKVRSGEAPSNAPAAATIPAAGTAQRKRAERDIEKLRAEKVIVTEANAVAKLATSVPPTMPVQGRRVEGHSEAPIYGDGTTTARSAVDFCIDTFSDHSVTPAELERMGLEQFKVLASRSVEAYSALPDVLPEDAVANMDHEMARNVIEDHLHRFSRRAKRGERTSALQYLESLLVGLPCSERIDDLRARVAEHGKMYANATVDAALMLDKQRAGDDVPGAEEKITAEDVKEGAKLTMNGTWRRDDENTARALNPTLDDDDVQAIVTSFGVDPNKHHFLKQLSQSHELSVFYYNEQGDVVRKEPVKDVSIVDDTLGLRERANGERADVVRDLYDIVEDFSMSNYMQTLRTEYTRDLHKYQATCETLRAKAADDADTPLSMAEAKELEQAEGFLRTAKRYARNEVALNKRLNHDHGMAALESKYRLMAVDLPTVPRNLIQRQLRAPLPNCAHKERPCLADNRCLGFVMAGCLRGAGAANASRRGFVLKEFLTEDMERQLEQKGVLPKERQYCYLCQVYITNQMYYKMQFLAEAGTTMMIIQPFKVIFGVPGEYAEESGNLCVSGTNAYGIVAPFPRFNQENYDYSTCTVTDDDGQDHVLPCLVEIDDVVFH